MKLAGRWCAVRHARRLRAATATTAAAPAAATPDHHSNNSPDPGPAVCSFHRLVRHPFLGNAREGPTQGLEARPIAGAKCKMAGNHVWAVPALKFLCCSLGPRPSVVSCVSECIRAGVLGIARIYCI